MKFSDHSYRCRQAGDPPLHARKALELTTEIALSWYEFRGFRVDRELQLVHLEAMCRLTDYVEDFF